MRHLIIASTFALTACASTPCVPKIEYRTVSVPTPVACVDASKVRSEPPSITLDKDARVAADQAAMQANLNRAWGRELYSLIIPCTK